MGKGLWEMTESSYTQDRSHEYRATEVFVKDQRALENCSS